MRKWKNVRWLLLAWTPMLGSYLWIVLVLAKNIGAASVILFMGTSFLLVCFGAIGNDFVDTNNGLFDRKIDPVRFWLNILIMIVAYVALIIALWVIGEK